MKDNKRIKETAAEVLKIMAREDFNIDKAEKFFEKIARKGIPMKELNNNYNAKKMERFLNISKDKHREIDFDEFTKMEYKEAL